MDINTIGSKIIEKFPEITSTLSKLIENKSFQDKLDKAGSIGALLNIGITLFTEIRKSLTRPEERAFAALLKIMLESAEKSRPELNELSFKKITNSKEDFIKELFDKFIVTTGLYSSPSSYLPYHPSIAKFREEICEVIRKEHEEQHQYLPDDIIRLFVFNYNKYIVDTVEKEATDGNKELHDLLHTWKVRRTSKKLTDYLHYVYALRFAIRGIDKKYLSEYYIPNRLIKVSTNTWGSLDYTIEQNYSSFHKWDVKQFLDSQNENEWSEVIGAPFGVGKTSFAIDLASNYAYDYLSNPNSPDNYIPIIVRLKDDLNNVYYQHDLDAVLDLIAKAVGSNEVNILVVLDGLDEYHEDIEKIVNLINEKHKPEKFPKIKFIITTRMEPGLKKLLKREYVRLLPFDRTQVEQLLEKYGLKYKFDEIMKFGLNEWEIKKPLFCWMISMVYYKSKDQMKYLANRTLLYHEFIHSVIKGKYIDEAKEYDDFDKYIRKEKKIMRKIAALRQIYADGLSKKTINEKIKEFGLEVSNEKDNSILNPILTSYFYPPTNIEDELIDFVHSTFKEYLLAEYYIESLFERKPYRLNARMPSKETIDFLDGLLDVLLATEDPEVQNFLSDEETGFLKSFGYSGGQEDARRDLAEIAYSSIEEDNIVLFSTNIDKTPNKNGDTREGIWRSASVQDSDYEVLLIHKWIALHIYSKLNQSQEKLSYKGIQGIIRFSSYLIPNYLKNLRAVDLRKSELGRANLREADLREVDLRKAKLIEADLTRADLRKAKLIEANLTRADLTRAKLTEEADLTRADLTGAILRGADLTGADLKETYFIGADLTGAILRGADLTDADLTEADLTGADLTEADLTRAAFSHAKNLPISKENAKDRGAIIQVTA